MKNLLAKIKNLFIRKTETNIEVCKDVFGNPVYENDYVIPITYNEFVRCGYATVYMDFYALHGKKLSPKQIKRGVIKQSIFFDLQNYNDNGKQCKIKNSNRKGFVHVCASLDKVLPQYRHRTA